MSEGFQAAGDAVVAFQNTSVASPLSSKTMISRSSHSLPGCLLDVTCTRCQAFVLLGSLGQLTFLAASNALHAGQDLCIADFVSTIEKTVDGHHAKKLLPFHITQGFATQRGAGNIIMNLEEVTIAMSFGKDVNEVASALAETGRAVRRKNMIRVHRDELANADRKDYSSLPYFDLPRR